jgi:hypothetical protein
MHWFEIVAMEQKIWRNMAISDPSLKGPRPVVHNPLLSATTTAIHDAAL